MSEAALQSEDEDYDPDYGGISRGYTMHWFDEEVDVLVLEIQPPLPQDEAYVGRHFTTDGVACTVLTADKSSYIVKIMEGPALGAVRTVGHNKVVELIEEDTTR